MLFQCFLNSTGVGGGHSWHLRGLIDEKPNGYMDGTPDTVFCILFQVCVALAGFFLFPFCGLQVFACMGR